MYINAGKLVLSGFDLHISDKHQIIAMYANSIELIGKNQIASEIPTSDWPTNHDGITGAIRIVVQEVLGDGRLEIKAFGSSYKEKQ